jgi:hypothetical protein
MAGFLGAIDVWSHPLQLAAVVAAGVAVDALLRRRPVRVTGFVAPPLLWGAWFAATAATEEITWSIDLWSGTLVWTGMLGFAIALLMTAVPPSPQPGPEPRPDVPETEPLVDARG